MFQILLFSVISLYYEQTGNELSFYKDITLSQTKNYNYLALGDSYTIGTGINSVSSYPRLLERNLKNIGWECQECKILAQSGWMSVHLMKQLEKENIPDNSYDLVTLLIGVNDQFRHSEIQQYKFFLTKLINEAMRISGSKDRIIIMTLPDYSATPSFNTQSAEKISEELDGFNEVIKKVSAEFDIRLVDLTPISKKAKNSLTYLAADALHPSLRMYEEWVALILPFAKEILNSNKK